MKKSAVFVSLVPLAVLAACALATEFVSMDAPEVTAFLPAGEFVSPREAGEMDILFSTGMRTSSVERAFSLRAEGRPVEGLFTWSRGDRRLVFSPLTPIPEPASYTLEVTCAAEDRHGNSLREDFRRVFHTRPELERPRVLRVSPEPGSAGAAPREAVRVFFSEPMEKASTAAAFSMVPAPPGFFSWEDEDRTLVFQPLEDYRAGVSYRARVASSAADLAGNSLGEDTVFVFTAAGEPWTLEGVETHPGGAVLPPPGPGEFLGPQPPIEKDQRFLLRFGSPVPPEDRRYLVSLLPSVPFTLSWRPPGDGATLEFSEPLAWDTLYELRVRDEVRRFTVNGEGSRPPAVAGVFFLPHGGAPEPERVELHLADNLALPDSEDAAFEILLTHGDGTGIVLASFLSSFSLTAGSGTVSPFRVETPASAPGTSLFRVLCRVSPGAEPGILRIDITKGLRDGRDNHLPEDFILTVNLL